MNELKHLLAFGNIKIPNTTAIFNMGAAHDCPSKVLGLCQAYKDGKHICYARKAEYSYRPQVYPYRKRQEQYWKQISADGFVMDFLDAIINKKNKCTALRLNESGDFWGQECVDKAEQIAKILDKCGIVVYCYTARRDLDFKKVKYLRISGSNFIKSGVVNEFKMVLDIKDRPKGYGVCMGDCNICNRCQRRGMKTVILSH